MILHLKKTFIISAVILFFTPLYSQNTRVYQLPILEQLPSNSVFRLFQDKEGYMWFGTQDAYVGTMGI